MNGVYADSTHKPMAARMRTVRMFLACWNLPLVPYTVDVVYALGASLKWRKYRSAENYLYLSKVVAEREGAHISQATHRALTDVIRSCKRGLGPAKHCEGLVLEVMPDLPASEAAWSTGGPWRPRDSLILGSWWMTREMEFANAELRSVSLNPVRRTVSWTLPACKTDTAALGATITHGCCCGDSNARCRPSPLCPYHLFHAHLRACFKRFRRRFDANGFALRSFPLFPDEDGAVCTKAGVTDTIRAAARHMGQRVVDPGGLFLHSGHALRVTGAQGLARAALQENMIALQARWGSTAIRGYIRKAPLAAAHTMAALAIAGWNRNADPAGHAAPFSSSTVRRLAAPKRRATVPPASSRVAAESRALSARVDTLSNQIRALTDWRTEVAASVPSPSVAPVDTSTEEVLINWDSIHAAFPFVYSDREKCHKVVVGYPAPPRTWKTKCGWPFGVAVVAEPGESPPACHKLSCEHCLKPEWVAVKAAAESRVREVGRASPTTV